MIAVKYNFLVLKDVSLHEEIFCVIKEPTFSYLNTKNRALESSSSSTTIFYDFGPSFFTIILFWYNKTIVSIELDCIIKKLKIMLIIRIIFLV